MPDRDETGPRGEPIECPGEVAGGRRGQGGCAGDGGEPPRPFSDGTPDYLDRDSDGDGLTDGEEVLFGTDPCDWDTDGDDIDDLTEAVLERRSCPDGPDAPGARACGCAVDAGCGVSDDFLVALLPLGGPEVTCEATTTSAGGGSRVTMTVAADGGDFVDPEDFFVRLEPACRYRSGSGDSVPDPRCWEPPVGTAVSEATSRVDDTAFVDLASGSQVTFRVTMRNETVPALDIARAYTAVLLVADQTDPGAEIATVDAILIVPP